MSLRDHDALDALCTACGIANDYYDIQGLRREPAAEVRQMLLAALGYPVSDDADVQRQRARLDTRDWRETVPPLLFYRQPQASLRLRLVLPEARCDAPVGWELIEESGHQRRGSWNLDRGAALDARCIDGIQLYRFEVELMEKLEPGYHRLVIDPGADAAVSCRLVVAPAACALPPALGRGRKIWGVSLQLYALRSARNWGIGDFGDLRAAIEILAPLGVDVVGINPLHALFLHQPQRASPYSPSSRDRLNPVYLDIEAIEDFGECAPARQLLAQRGFQQRLQALRDAELVDYPGVWAAKLQVLEVLYRSFSERHLAAASSRGASFRQFQRQGGEALRGFGRFEALQLHFFQQDQSCQRWQQWPPEFQDPNSAAVAAWAARHEREIEFHQYLQWLAEQQLACAQDCCRGQGMAVGLYRDLAVGNEESAAQIWAQPELYARAVSVGAPPDDFSSDGQNWGLPPLRPPSVEAGFYRQFARTLGANMRHAGALRIDHIMGLMRLYWIPRDSSSAAGSYLSYPLQDLLAIIALESHRNRCLVIGEDLGTVPDEVRHALAPNNILSFRILCFEKDWQLGRFRAPAEYPQCALCTAGSHDLPTLGAWWQGTDIEARASLQRLPSPEATEQQHQARARDRRELCAALEREGLLPAARDAGADYDAALAAALHRYLARSSSALMMVQLEDLLLQRTQVNLPGTIDEHPNWRCKLPLDLECWRDDPDFVRIARAVDDERRARDERRA